MNDLKKKAEEVLKLTMSQLITVAWFLNVVTPLRNHMHTKAQLDSMPDWRLCEWDILKQSSTYTMRQLVVHRWQAILR